jgi:hypothetical protein
MMELCKQLVLKEYGTVDRTECLLGKVEADAEAGRTG